MGQRLNITVVSNILTLLQ